MSATAQVQEFTWKEEIEIQTIDGPQKVCGWVYGDSGLCYHPRMHPDKSLSDLWHTITHIPSGKAFPLLTASYDFANPVLAMRFIEKLATFTNWNRLEEEIRGEWKGKGLGDKCYKLYERLSKNDMQVKWS